MHGTREENKSGASLREVVSGPGVSHRLRPCRFFLDYSLFIGYNVMSHLWRKMTPIPAPDPAACTPPGLFCLACRSFHSPLAGTLFASCMSIQTSIRNIP